MDPNSAGQLWAKWTFEVYEPGRHVQHAEVELNAARWLRRMFGSASTMRVVQTIRGWRIELLSEGKPAHDPAFVESVKGQFQRSFVEKGWGPLALSKVSVKVMAGDKQDGKPREQMLIVPRLDLNG